MTEANIGSIAIAVLKRHRTNTGSVALADMAYDNSIYIQTLTGETGLQSKYVPAIIALTAADAIRRDAADEDVSLADFSYGGQSGHKAIDQLETRANRILNKFTTRSVNWEKVNG